MKDLQQFFGGMSQLLNLPAEAPRKQDERRFNPHVNPAGVHAR
jgi:hypothetical protein